MRKLPIIFIILCLTSCVASKKHIVYVDRDVNHYITNTVHDTLREKTTDSVYVEIKTKGDTVYNTKYVERVRWKDRKVYVHDTCYRDSIVTVVEKEEIVKEVIKIPKIFRLAFVFSIIIIIFATIKVIRWLRIR